MRGPWVRALSPPLSASSLSAPSSLTLTTLSLPCSPHSGQTEGCFNDYAALLAVYFSATDVLSNAKCQSVCADHGFVTAATIGRACQCGNIYPSIFHRVDDRRCNNPCSLDRTTCTLSSCCGDRNNKFYTVSFAGEIEPRRELLRQLAFDYREGSPQFKAHIEGLMAQTTSLQVLRSSSSASFGASNGGAAPPPPGASSMASSFSGDGPETGTFVGLGEGCPTGWLTSDDSCYKATVGAAPINQADAQSECAAVGGMLASVMSATDNTVTNKMLQGQTGWLGLTTSSRPSGYTWGWAPYGAWEVNQPDSASFALRSPQAYGPVSGGAFDDYTRNISGLASLTVGYALGSIVSLQATYRLKNGSIVAMPVRGGEARLTETLTLGVGDRITKVEGVTNSNVFQGLSITVTDALRRRRVWGPLGSSAKPTFSYRPTSEVIALYGRFSAKTLNQLGFYEFVGKQCGRINDQGLWEAVYCDEKAPAPFYLCEKPQGESRRDCPSGWVNFGQSCFKSEQSVVAMSWLDAAAACREEGGWLARVDSAAKRDAAWGLMQGARGFIGLHDALPTSQDSLWGWDYYTNWENSDEPAPVLNDVGDQVDAAATCVVLKAQTGKWSTVKCSASVANVAPVCESPVLDDECTCPNGWVAWQCSCYYYGSSVSADPAAATQSWLDVQKNCGILVKGASLPLPRSADNNAALLQALVQSSGGNGAGASMVFLGLRDTFGQGTVIPEVWTAWGGDNEPAPSQGLCGSMRADGTWYAVDCKSSLKAYVCRIPRAATAAYVGADGQKFEISLIPGQKIAWGSPLDVEIAQSDSGVALAVDSEGGVYPMPTSGSDQGNASTRFTFYMATAGNTVGAFLLQSADHGSFLYSDPSTGQLKAVVPPADANKDNTNSSEAMMDLVRNGHAALFTVTHVVPALGIQNLAISLVAKGNADAGPMLCSMYVYDLTPESTSFKCYEVQGSTDGLPVVNLEMAAWINQDRTTVLSPRVPLDMGRLVCENTNPYQSSTCSATYGQALGIATTISMMAGYILQDTYQILYLDPKGNFWNMAIMRTNTYTDVILMQYLQTNQYTANVPVPPQTTVILQFWQSTVALNYVWNALFAATGSFQLSSLGFNIDSPRSLSAVSSPQDLFFYLWGRFQYPTQGELIISSNQATYNTWPFDRPANNNVP